MPCGRRHTALKSSSRNLGATQLATLSKELEHPGTDRRLEGAAELLQAFESPLTCGCGTR